MISPRISKKKLSEVRKWVNTNLDNDTTLLFRRIYDSLYETLVSSSIPAAVLIPIQIPVPSSICSRSGNKSTCMFN